jgi:hypothetical protein
MAKSIKSRESRISLCGKAVIFLEGVITGIKYVRVLLCDEFLCPVCGAKNGPIHRKRKIRMIQRIKRFYGILDGLAFRKFVFTLPEQFRDDLLSKDKLNKFIRIAVGVVQKFYPGRLISSDVHLFGDRDLVYKPHVNVYVTERISAPGKSFGVKMKIDPGVLCEVKARYIKGLRGAGYSLDAADVNYTFTLKKPQFLHSIRYLTRPCPDYTILKALETENSSLYDFLLSDEMRNFKYIRHSRQVVDQSQFVPGDEVLKLEKLRYVDRDHYTMRAFFEAYRCHERIEVYPGFYAYQSGGFSDEERAYLNGGRILNGGGGL